MEHVALIFPPKREASVKAAKEAFEILSSCRIQVLSQFPGMLGTGAMLLHEDSRIDAIVSLGGDGTVLRCVQMAISSTAPVLGINLGQTGFLTETEGSCLEEALFRLVRSEYSIRTLPLLHVHAQEDWYALNDCTLLRTAHQRLPRIQISVDGHLADEFQADGVVIATPTGSTGYALSAGGPLIVPGTDCLVVTPVCPHKLSHRPMIIPGTSTVDVHMVEDPESMGMLQVDGVTVCSYEARGVFRVKRSDQSIRFISFGEQDFFEAVRNKLIR
ncbi:MAG: NAD(+)/NADH kinase [Clostridia bacterium]|nr:NAD(+)/NADH kinase [Clostridia bacterium]